MAISSVPAPRRIDRPVPGWPIGLGAVDGHVVERLYPVAGPGPAGEPVPADPDLADTWFRTTFLVDPAAADEELWLRFDGLATLADVDLDGERILESDSMFLAHSVDVTDLAGGRHDLTIQCRSLAPALAERRRPRARWRTKLVRDNDLRWIRTMIMGRAPGFAPGPAIAGPWQPVWLERRRRLAVDDLSVRASIEGDTGVLRVAVALRAIGAGQLTGATVELTGPDGTHQVAVALDPVGGVDGARRGEATVRVPRVTRWWPHTHGDPARHEVAILAELDGDVVRIDAGSVGFRTIAAGVGADHDIERDGLALVVNDVPIFARGALWTPLPGAVASGPDAAAAVERDLDATLELVRHGGMNLLRIPGTGAYESAAFHDRCDRLGLLVWQDLAFANLDYPFADEAFADRCVREVRQLLGRIGGRPSTVVICGNSEVEQQVAMLGLPAAQWRDPFYGETLPALVAEAACDAVVIPSAPFGGDRPFTPHRGVANYFGVGGYRRPISDARLAAVRFASESLAFANVPEEATIERLLPDAPGDISVNHPAWKAGVPRDNGAGWDFDDVRDHYLATWTGLDPVELRRVDQARYLESSRAVTGEVMAEVFGEWRRPESPCAGALILWLRDLVPGAGWGLLDDRGAPKVAYHHLRRALAPIAVWTTDEGLAGIAVHVANDGPSALAATLRVALYRDGEVRVGEGTAAVTLAGHTSQSLDLETILGGFVDASWAYRFGPPEHDLIVATLETAADDEPMAIAQAFRSMPGRVREPRTADRLGLAAEVSATSDGSHELRIDSRRYVSGMRVLADGWIADDQAFALEPGHRRIIRLRPAAEDPADLADPVVALTSIDLVGRVVATREAGR